MDDNNRGASYDAIYFDSFGVENILEKIKKFIGKQIYNDKHI